MDSLPSGTNKIGVEPINEKFKKEEVSNGSTYKGKAVQSVTDDKQLPIAKDAKYPEKKLSERIVNSAQVEVADDVSITSSGREYNKKHCDEIKKILVGINQEPIEYYHQSIEKLHKLYNVTPEEVEKWNNEAQALNLKSDPVISDILNLHFGDRLLEIGREFVEKGPGNFCCKEFHVCLENMNSHMEHLKANHSDDWSDEINKMQSQIEKLQNEGEEVNYKELLMLSFKCSEISSEIDDFGMNNNNLKKRSKEELKILVNLILDMDIDIENISKNEIKNLSSMFFGSDFSIYKYQFASGLEMINKVLSDKDGKIMWPCYDILDLDFFINSSVYNIYAAGLSPTPLAFHDGVAFNSKEFYLHDLTHADTNKSEASDFTIKKKVALDIDKIKEKFSDDPKVVTGLSFMLFVYHHESGKCISKLSTEGFKLDSIMENQLITGIKSGYYDIEDLTIEGIVKAYAVLKEEFPVVV